MHQHPSFPVILFAALMAAFAAVAGNTHRIRQSIAESNFEIKQMLSERNELPEFLQHARIGGVSFRDVNKGTWRDISCAASTRFVDESQVRAYLLDYVLD